MPHYKPCTLKPKNLKLEPDEACIPATQLGRRFFGSLFRLSPGQGLDALLRVEVSGLLGWIEGLHALRVARSHCPFTLILAWKH